MSEPERLFDSLDAPPLLRDALRAARAEAPTRSEVDALCAGVLAGLGIPPPGGGGGSGPSGPTQAPPLNPPPAAPAAGASSVATFGAFAAVAALVVGAVVLSSERQESPAPQAALSPAGNAEGAAPQVQVPTPSASVNDARSSAEARPEASAEASPEASSAPSAAPSATSATPAPASSARVVEPPSETELLDAAQQALASRPAEALRRCADHAKLYPGGVLSQEREVIAIEALVRTGQSAEAKRRADAFRAAHPGSGHLRRIDVILGGAPQP